MCDLGHNVTPQYLQRTNSAPGRDTWCDVWSGGGKVGDVDAIPVQVVMTQHLQWTNSAPGRDTWCNVWSGGGRVGDVDVACSHDLASTVDRFCSS